LNLLQIEELYKLKNCTPLGYDLIRGDRSTGEHRRRLVINIGGQTKIWGKASILGGIASPEFWGGRVAGVRVAGES